MTTAPTQPPPLIESVPTSTLVTVFMLLSSWLTALL